MKLVAICPSLERLDLVQQLALSWRVTAPVPTPEFVVVAVGADDGTEGWCRHQGFTVERVEKATFAQACNLGAKAHLGDADWVLLLNNDLILKPGWPEALAEMDSLHYDIVGARLTYPDRRLQHRGKAFTLDMYPFHVDRFQRALKEGEQPEDVRPFPAVTFAMVAIRANVWRGLDGLDEEFENGYEDDDFCLRAREAGAQIGVHPRFAATHLESQTTGRDNANKEAQWLKFKQRWVETDRIAGPIGVLPVWRSVG